MKYVILLFVSLFFSSIEAQEVVWQTSFEKAKKVAKSEQKPILMYFTGSDWCSPCKMLKKDFWESDTFKKQSDSFVLLEVDIPFRNDIISPEQKQMNMELQKKYNNTKAFPTLLALDSRGKVLDKISAYSMLRDTAPYFAFIERVKKLR